MEVIVSRVSSLTEYADLAFPGQLNLAARILIDAAIIFIDSRVKSTEIRKSEFLIDQGWQFLQKAAGRTAHTISASLASRLLLDRSRICAVSCADFRRAAALRVTRSRYCETHLLRQLRIPRHHWFRASDVTGIKTNMYKFLRFIAAGNQKAKIFEVVSGNSYSRPYR